VHYYYSAENDDEQPLSTRETFAENGDTLVSDYTTLNKDSFLGFKFDGSGNITNAYACGINADNNNAAFCLEGTTSASAFTANVGVLNTAFPGCDIIDPESEAMCMATVSNAYVTSDDYVVVSGGSGNCNVDFGGYAGCYGG